MASSAYDFNDFIDDMGLIDVPMIGKQFTRIDAIGSKLSKLDRFLVDEAFYDRFENLQVSVLDRRWSDHCPIFLHVSLVDYGPSSFKFFNSLLELDVFNDMVKDAIKEFVVDMSWSKFVLFKNKLKFLKDQIKNGLRVIKRLVDIDKIFDDGGSSDDLACERRQQRCQRLIRGISIDREWVADPPLVKKAFYDFYASKFQTFKGLLMGRKSDRFRSIDPDTANSLESVFSSEEIKWAVWDYGLDLASGPDGFSFRFLRHFWEFLGDDVVAFVQEFSVNPRFPIESNSSFITLIPKIDNHIRINDYHPISLIGLYFKIIAKLLANRLAPVLHDVIGLEQSAFLKSKQILDGRLLVNEMRAWIKGMFSNDCSTVLLNGCPTDEFQLLRGLRQGDPLSPFLFIIAMEGLHIDMEDAVSEGVFKGAQLEPHDLAISHLFYADDAIFLGEWNENNVHNLIRVLRCFYLVSGLNLNLSKSSLYGVGVSRSEISNLASFTGCSAGSFPFMYLSVLVGESMASCCCLVGLGEYEGSFFWYLLPSNVVLLPNQRHSLELTVPQKLHPTQPELIFRELHIESLPPQSLQYVP
uniref:Reverse transcriptase domain-containing protein n=1 Tax=Lactuca sativa TaxID=4236 RepID=A0A9R1VYA0_LACSA|nr:hypothetical protein LSAT_V11C300102750 [Lactuca sativa]